MAAVSEDAGIQRTCQQVLHGRQVGGRCIWRQFRQQRRMEAALVPKHSPVWKGCVSCLHMQLLTSSRRCRGRLGALSSVSADVCCGSNDIEMDLFLKQRRMQTVFGPPQAPAPQRQVPSEIWLLTPRS